MSTIAAAPSRIYVGTDKTQGMAIGLDAKKNVHLHLDKNLRLAIFVPEKARGGGHGAGSHVATGVSRAAYHQLRACSARSSQNRQSAALNTSVEIFRSVPGLAETASTLEPAQQIELAKRMADGRFEFAYQALPPELQGRALALEVAGEPGDLALWHQSMVYGGGAAQEGQSPSAIAVAAEAFCQASNSDDRALARTKLMTELVQSTMLPLEEALGSIADFRLQGRAADALAESTCAKNLASLALTPAGHLMPAAFFKTMAEALGSSSVLKAEPPAPALRQFLVAQLSALATKPELRQCISSISAPPPENAVMEDQLRADLVIAPPAPLTAGDARKAVIGALLTPLRQGEVGSCFATSVAIRQQIDQPQAMVAQLKTMIERGYIEGKSGIRTERLPLNPGQGQSSPRLSSNTGPAKLQEIILQSALTLALGRARPGDSREERSEMASDILRPHLAQSGVHGRTLEFIVRDALAEAMGLKFDLPAASAASSERMKPLLQLLRASNSPAEQLDIVRTAITDLNAGIHRLSQAEPVDDAAIDMAITDLQAMQALLPSQFDLGQFEQAASLAGSRLHTLDENRLLRTWEFSMASAGLGRSRQMELHSTLVTQLLAPRIEALSPAAAGPVSASKRGELSALLESRISNRIKSDLVYQHMTEIPQELALDGQSSRGGWVLFDRGGASDPSQWRRIDGEHELRMTLRGLVREASRDLAQSRSSKASREHVKTLGKLLETGLQGADFERTVRQTTDRAATYQADLVESLVDTFLSAQIFQPAQPVAAGMFKIDRLLALMQVHSLKHELSQCLSDRLVFTAAPASGGRTQWLVHDSQVPPPPMPDIAKSYPHLARAWAENDGLKNKLLTEKDLKAAIARILGDLIANASRAGSGVNGDLTQIRHKVAAMDLSASLVHLNPTTATSDAQVHRPVWSIDGGGFGSQVMAWMGAAGQEVQLINAAASPRGPEEFFAQMVKTLPRIRPDATAAGQPLLVRSNSHAFSLTPQSWQEALNPAAGDPKAWLQQCLQPGQHLKLADMNWGTGSHPMHLAVGRVNGQIEFGWAEGDRFAVDPNAKAFAQQKWEAWKDACAGSGRPA